MKFEIEKSSLELEALLYELQLASWMKLADEVARRIYSSLKSNLKLRLSRKLRVLLQALDSELPSPDDEFFNEIVCKVYTSFSVFKALMDARAEWKCADDFEGILFYNLIKRIGSKGFHNAYKEEDKLHKRRAESLYDYISDLKIAHSKIMIVRLDLYYHQEVIQSIRSQQNVVDDWSRLLAFARKSYKQNFLGYAMKIEFGGDRGVHVHSIFIMNGSNLKRDVNVARSLGHYWVKDVVPGIGRYFNCNEKTHQEKYKWRAVGTFTKMDEEFQNGVKAMSAYVTKPDPLPRLVVHGLKKRFRKGELNERQKERVRRRKDTFRVSRDVKAGMQ
ncbi:inovirus Gp2 family protein [Comamonas aquatica]|uniref:inovirus-type Gp2 protein n=1 Tax=Comamonas aquatica TaxID=225991 RepID=UPI0024470619|nr:inovirus-type Gp2 protein [Comamonas aquatica]MDH0373716.1 inovirus Gp2 family protein [Comamonas aquatica]